METRIPKSDGPHYMAELVFSRDGDNIVIEVVDAKNYQKAAYAISAVRLNLLVDLLLSEGSKEPQ